MEFHVCTDHQPLVCLFQVQTTRCLTTTVLNLMFVRIINRLYACFRRGRHAVSPRLCWIWCVYGSSATCMFVSGADDTLSRHDCVEFDVCADHKPLVCLFQARTTRCLATTVFNLMFVRIINRLYACFRRGRHAVSPRLCWIPCLYGSSATCTLVSGADDTLSHHDCWIWCLCGS